MAKIYLAGPDVFRENAQEHFTLLKELCKEHGHEGLSPFDNEVNTNIVKELLPKIIFDANRYLIRKCDVVLANLDMFRGPNVDDGTAWEIGYALALGKKIYGYTDTHDVSLKVKTLATIDDMGDYPLIENFNLPNNLMIVESISASGGTIESCFHEALKRIS